MRLLIGIDIGATKIRGVLVNIKGKVIKSKEILIEGKREKDLINIMRILKEFDSKKVKGIGIGIPGFLDLKREKIVTLPNLKGWENFGIKKYLQEKIKKKVLIENDGNCLAIAESRFGRGVGYDNFISLNIGTGLGGGIIISKRIYRGAGNAGEFGHMTIGGKQKCACGRRGCLEGLISGPAIEKYAKKIGLNKKAEKIFELAKQGNKKAERVFKKMGENLGRGLVNLVFAFDPEIILIGGGVASAGELLIRPAREYLKSKMKKKIKVKRVKLLKNGGAVGAASLFF